MVTVRRSRTKGFLEVDIRLMFPDGQRYRERKKAPVQSLSLARRWGQQREMHLIQRWPNHLEREVPTVRAFSARFIREYAKANRQKVSSVVTKESILRVHLLPRFGHLRLNQLREHDIQLLKNAVGHRKPKTVNQILSVLGTMLRVAVRWGVIREMPTRIDLLRTSIGPHTFYDFDAFDRLVEGSRQVDELVHAVVLLGGDAGLRCGEVLALEWNDVEFDRRTLTIQRSEWMGNVSTPKSGRFRIVPMTAKLSAVLEALPRRGARIILREDQRPVTQKILRVWMMQAQAKAGLPKTGRLHDLRHTFCSRLAMRSAPLRTIQELAGHTVIQTTMRYMHLADSARSSAIRLLDG